MTNNDAHTLFRDLVHQSKNLALLQMVLEVRDNKTNANKFGHLKNVLNGSA